MSCLIRGEWAGWGRAAGGRRTEKRESVVLPISSTFFLLLNASFPSRMYEFGIKVMEGAPPLPHLPF